MRPDEAKVTAMNDMPAPHSPEARHRFLDMINYLSSSVISARRLLPCASCYRETCAGAGKHLVQKLDTSTPQVLKFYFPAKPAKLSVDASTIGLAAACLQDGCHVAYT